MRLACAGKYEQMAEPLLVRLQPDDDIPIHEIPGKALAFVELVFELLALTGNFVAVLICKMTPIVCELTF
jgi:hypothetical protein